MSRNGQKLDFFFLNGQKLSFLPLAILLKKKKIIVNIFEKNVQVFGPFLTLNGNFLEGQV